MIPLRKIPKSYRKRPIPYFLCVLLSFGYMFMLTKMATMVTAKQDNVCPHGGEWSEHQDPEDFNGPVEGATEYCWKGGSERSNCEGFLFQSGNPFAYPIQGDHVCDLSHWSYKLGSTATPSPTPTESPNPSSTPTSTPVETPTETPTATPTPSETPSLTPTPTSTPTPTPTQSSTPQPTNHPQWEEVRKREGEVFGPQK